MSKNFEQEYKEYIEGIKPDLWNKIAGQLPDRSEITTEESVGGEVIAFPTKKANVKQNIKARRFKRYSGIIAACLCVAILVPVYMTNREQIQKDSQANAFDSQKNSESSVVVDDKYPEPMDKSSVTCEVVATVEVLENNEVAFIVVESFSPDFSEHDVVRVVLPEDVELDSDAVYQVELKKEIDGTYSFEDAVLYNKE